MPSHVILQEDVEKNIPQTSESLSEGDEDRTQMVDQETSSVDHDILKLNFGNKGGIFNKNGCGYWQVPYLPLKSYWQVPIIFFWF